MSADAVVTTLKSTEAARHGRCRRRARRTGLTAFKQSGELLDKLIKAEVAEREVRSINYQMKIATLPGPSRSGWL